MDFFNTNFVLQTPHHEDQSQPILSSCTPQDQFHGGVAHSLLGKRVPSMSLMNNPNLDPYEDHHNHHHHQIDNNGCGEDDLSDDGTQLGEKKRRLNIEQVRTLEKSFELHNKLEPERKMQLAKTLGLQPRQIAIWFQNRRARWKTKQLERDYEVLKRQFDAVKAENDSLQSQNQKLHAEVMALKSNNRDLPTKSINLNNKDTEGSCSNKSENSSENIKLDISTAHNNQTANIDDGPKLSNFGSKSALLPSQQNSPGIKHLMNPNGVITSTKEMDHHNHVSVIKEEGSLCNIFCNGMEEHTGFWPWLEQHNLN